MLDPGIGEAAKLIEQLDKRVAESSAGNSELLVEDVRAQLARIDQRAAVEHSPQMRVVARRAALVVLELMRDGHRRGISYEGMLARPPGAPTEPPFLVELTRISGAAVLKAYGVDRRQESWLLGLTTEKGWPGFVELLGSGRTPDGTWLLLERLEGPSLSAVWGPTDRPLDVRDALPVTKEIASSCRELHELAVAHPGWPALSGALVADLSGFTRALAEHLYGDYVGQAPDALSASLTVWPERVLTHGDVFAGNVVRRRPTGPHVLIDPTPVLAPRSFDAAKWICSTGAPKAMGPLVVAWTGVEALDAVELATCLSVQLWRHAGTHEICKPIRDPAVVERYGLPRSFVDSGVYDDGTAAALSVSIRLREAVSNGELSTIDDVVELLDSAVA